jgi:hypothetical protein
VVLSSAPALIAGLAGVSGGAARRPYYTDVEGRLPLIHWIRLLKDLPESLAPAMAAAVVLAVLGDQLVTGGALAMLDPGRPAGERVRVLATVLREGLTHLWAFLRAAALGLVILAFGVVLIRLPFKQLDLAGYRSGWTGKTVMLTLPVLHMFAMLLWMATSGAWVFWCRLITAADGRRRVRRTGLLALQVLWRHPLRSWGVFVTSTIATMLLSGAVLIAWRQAEPGTRGGALAWFLLWLLTLLIQSFVWLWLLCAGRALYDSGGLEDLRSKPDDPFRLFEKLAWWRRASVKPSAAPAEPPPAPKPPPEGSSRDPDPEELPPEEHDRSSPSRPVARCYYPSFLH